MVDDENYIRRMLLEFLHDHVVVCCEGSESALQEFGKTKFDYVLLDICMRDSMNGIELMRKLKEIDPDAKIILASGRIPEDIDKEALEEAHGHLLKPYKLDDLASLLDLTATV